MADPARARRLATRIQQVVAASLGREVKDPRLAMVTITDARVTGDLRDAELFWTVLGDDTARAEAAAALDSAKGILRSLVGKATGVRFTPTLTFTFDPVPEHVNRIDALVGRVRAADAERRAALGQEAGSDESDDSDDVDDATAVAEESEAEQPVGSEELLGRAAEGPRA